MRFPKYQSLFQRLSEQLTSIQEDSDQLPVLHELQRQLIRAILGVERRVLRLKKARHRLTRIKARTRLTKARSTVVKALVAGIDARVADLHQVMFLIRCFGDGIAFTYQSKYSLKHLMFDGNYQAKQMPGFMTGKAGFFREYKVLCSGFKAGVPVVLADITNIIRHGDVCALAGEDPVPIEVKSSRTARERPKRQHGLLQVLADFFKNDGAANFRGVPNVKRTEIHAKETTFEVVINDCIGEALANGSATREPEEGLRYLAFRTDFVVGREESALDELLRPHVGEVRMTVCPTPDPTWWHSMPFTLTLQTGNLIAFMQEQVHFLVVIDLRLTKEMFRQAGVHAIAVFDGMSSFQISSSSGDLSLGVFRISEPQFLRISHDFQSLRWFVAENAAYLASMKDLALASSEPLTEEEVAGLATVDAATQEAWANARDVWDRPPQELGK